MDDIKIEECFISFNEAEGHLNYLIDTLPNLVKHPLNLVQDGMLNVCRTKNKFDCLTADFAGIAEILDFKHA